MSQGDGHIDPAALPDPEQLDALAGFFAGVLTPMLESMTARVDERLAELSDEIARAERRLRHEIREAARPPLMTLQDLVAYSRTSESTVRRTLKALQIPQRNVRGRLWQDGDGPVLYSRREWIEGGPVHTRQVMAELRRSGQTEPLPDPRSGIDYDAAQHEEAMELLALARSRTRPRRRRRLAPDSAVDDSPQQ